MSFREKKHLPFRDNIKITWMTNDVIIHLLILVVL